MLRRSEIRMMFTNLLLVSLFATASVALVSGPGVKTPNQPIPGAYIYEFEDGADTADVYRSLEIEGKIRMKLNYKLFNGVSVQLAGQKDTENRAYQIAEKPAVKKIWPVFYYELPKTEFQPVGAVGETTLAGRADSNDTFGPHVMMQVDQMRAKGITGKGIKVAVIDSGVDYKHPALGGCFGDGCLVSFGYDLVGDEYDGGNEPKPDPDPMDCGSHGTHVTGIIAAQPNELGFTGVAPGVTIGSYKVFGCEGGVGTDVLISAANKAVEDGADIITSSIGSDSGWTVDAWTNLLSRISEEKGIPCTVAGGNSGARGAFFPSGPSNGENVNAIASFDNVDTTAILSASTFSVDGGGEKRFGYSPGDPKAWDKVQLPVYAVSFDTTIKDDGCQEYPSDTPDLSKYIVLLRRGTCTFVQKAQNAFAKGAKFVMFYNNEPGAISISVKDVKGILAAGMVTPDVGESWIKALAGGQNITISMVGPDKADKYVQTDKNTKTGGAISGFSSWGPTMEMKPKPQFGAPGGNILSTLPRSFGYYGLASGTSMSTPMTAAVIALIGEARKTLEPQLIRHLLSANANPQLYNDGSQFAEYLTSVGQQGSGLIQAYDSAYATSLLEPASLAFNDTDHLKKELSFTLTNMGDDIVTYRFSNVPAITVYTLQEGSIYPSDAPNEVTEAAATLRFSRNRVVLPPGVSARVKVRPTPPREVDEERLALWSGYIAVNGTDGTSLSLPYEGLAGSLRQATTLAEDGSWISRSTDEDLKPVPENTVFELPKPGTAAAKDGIPVVVVKLALGSAFVTADAVPAGSSEPMGKIAGTPYKWLTRNRVGFYWTGQLDDGSYVPAGDYTVKCEALRVLGDPERDWDSSTTIQISIKYKE